jgi:hypothetical protein
VLTRQTLACGGEIQLDAAFARMPWAVFYSP